MRIIGRVFHAHLTDKTGSSKAGMLSVRTDAFGDFSVPVEDVAASQATVGSEVEVTIEIKPKDAPAGS